MRKPVAVALTAALALGLLAFGGWKAYEALYQRFTPEVCTVDLGNGETTTLTAEQARNASVIVAASIQRGLPERAAVVAIATAYQESALRNLDYGDRDSLGLFQQRPSYGWGTEEQIMDPWYTSNRFYEELVKFTNWEGTDVNDMAQKVQRSGFPEAYRKHVTKSEAVAGALRGTRPTTLSCLSFAQDPTPNPDSFAKVLEAFGSSITIDGAGTPELRITGQDEATTWAVAQHVVANSYDGGVASVVVGNREWVHDEAGWHDAKKPQSATTVLVTFG